jgi:hypothetical protein
MKIDDCNFTSDEQYVMGRFYTLSFGTKTASTYGSTAACNSLADKGWLVKSRKDQEEGWFLAYQVVHIKKLSDILHDDIQRKEFTDLLKYKRVL